MFSEFLQKLASADPTPGGGTASALSGAMGAALLAMVAKLSTKEHLESEVVSRKAEALLKRCQELAEEDEKAFDAVVVAYKLPKSGEDEKLKRVQSIQEALKKASEVPMQTAQTSLDILRLDESFVSKANRNAVSDLGVSALLAHAALEGALFNVLINLGSIKDKTFVDGYAKRSREISSEGKFLSEKVLAAVRSSLSF